jgi:hypothetical protein
VHLVQESIALRVVVDPCEIASLAPDEPPATAQDVQAEAQDKLLLQKDEEADETPPPPL